MLDDALTKVTCRGLGQEAAILNDERTVHAESLINCLNFRVADLTACHDADWVAWPELNGQESEQRHPDQHRQRV